MLLVNLLVHVYVCMRGRVLAQRTVHEAELRRKKKSERDKQIQLELVVCLGTACVVLFCSHCKGHSDILQFLVITGSAFLDGSHADAYYISGVFPVSTPLRMRCVTMILLQNYLGGQQLDASK